jgi:hypothetical protein
MQREKIVLLEYCGVLWFLNTVKIFAAFFVSVKISAKFSCLKRFFDVQDSFFVDVENQ